MAAVAGVVPNERHGLVVKKCYQYFPFLPKRKRLSPAINYFKDISFRIDMKTIFLAAFLRHHADFGISINIKNRTFKKLLCQTSGVRHKMFGTGKYCSRLVREIIGFTNLYKLF